MKTTRIPMKRHPMTAIAFALMTMLAAGCTSERDNAAGYSASAPATPDYRDLERMMLDSRRRTRIAAEANGEKRSCWPSETGMYNQDCGHGGSRASYAPIAQWQPRPAAAQPSAAPAVQASQLMQWERRDMGVPPTRELHDGQMHGATPNQIPGGQVITTAGVKALLEQQVGAQLIDVLGAEASLPDAIPAVWASAPGSFDDPTQEKLARMLVAVTRNNPETPLVFFCGGPECWMSYNAALRAIALGYRNVVWYRGGLEAWNHAGLPLARRAAAGNGYDRG